MIRTVEQQSSRLMSQANKGFWSPERLEAPVSFELLAREQHPHCADLMRHKIGECELIALDCPAGTLRSKSEAKASGQLCVLLINRGSVSGLTISGETVFAEGDLLLHEDGARLELQFAAPAQFLMLSLPLAVVRQRLEWLRRLAGLHVSGTHGPGALLSAFMRDAWQGLQRYDGTWSASLCEVLWPMIEMVFTAERANLVEASRSEERRQCLFSFIDKNLCEPDLDTRTMADVTGTSTRYVQMLFSKVGTTPSAFVRNRRLELAAAQLARGGPNISITAVAFNVGFNDLSSFCRAFRKRFDLTPRDYRAGCRSQAIAA